MGCSSNLNLITGIWLNNRLFTGTNLLMIKGLKFCRCTIVAQDGMTALHVAAERGDEHLCQKLVEAGAVLDITDEVCFSKFHRNPTSQQSGQVRCNLLKGRLRSITFCYTFTRNQP